MNGGRLGDRGHLHPKLPSPILHKTSPLRIDWGKDSQKLHMAMRCYLVNTMFNLQPRTITDSVIFKIWKEVTSIYIMGQITIILYFFYRYLFKLIT